MLDDDYLILVSASNDEAWILLAGEIGQSFLIGQSISRQFQQPMKSLLRHLKPKPVSGNRHPVRYSEKKYNHTQCFAKFSLFFEVLLNKKVTRRQTKNIKFYSYAVCFVLHGIFSMFFVDIFEVLDR